MTDNIDIELEIQIPRYEVKCEHLVSIRETFGFILRKLNTDMVEFCDRNDARFLTTIDLDFYTGSIDGYIASAVCEFDSKSRTITLLTCHDCNLSDIISPDKINTELSERQVIERIQCHLINTYDL